MARFAIMAGENGTPKGKQVMDKFPEHLIAAKPRMLKDLEPGERCAFPLYAIRVNAERNAFAFSNAELPPPLEDKLEYGEIWLDEKGQYHLSIPNNTKQRWKVDDLRVYEMNSNKWLVPIETISWGAE
jgi:hypothetical protein